MPTLSQPRLPPRDRLLQAAETLFYQDGITRVTVDAIAEKAQSTKMTLYRHFASKEALVLAWIGLLIEDYGQVFDRLAEQFPHEPTARIRGFGAFLADNLTGTLQRGCPFTNTLAETTGQFPEVRALIFAHKQRQFQRLVDWCTEAGSAEPQALAKEITLLLEGLQVVAQNGGFEDPAGFVLEKLATRLDGLTATKPG
ncbi:TetR/AcrR family transcriptional regulator [Erwinia sp.]|uniref:TetR/AcrR family transcriptional regulator n=1 Tax=Erwinia citreus TaxID=558 RepID=UPI00289987AC|nr:TetR/AcrR family transcriptional regulator [Erwinia sp.]